MGKTTIVQCDQCGHDLTYTGNCEDWRILLAYEALTPWFVAEGKRSGVLTDMAKEPPLDRSYTFCDIPCLAVWLGKTAPKAVEGYERLMKHRAWLAEKAKQC